MGLILDTGVFIIGERSGLEIPTLLSTVAGRIEGRQATLGKTIAFEDLVIGCTALFLGFSILTANPKHFALIPPLSVLAL